MYYGYRLHQNKFCINLVYLKSIYFPHGKLLNKIYSVLSL